MHVLIVCACGRDFLEFIIMIFSFSMYILLYYFDPDFYGLLVSTPPRDCSYKNAIANNVILMVMEV